MCQLNSTINFSIFDSNKILSNENPIAEGGFGSIYKGKYLSNPIVKKQMKKLDIPVFLKEIINTHIYRGNSSPAIYGMCEDVLSTQDNKKLSTPSIIIEYINGGDLRHSINHLDDCKVKLPENKLRFLIYMIELAKELDYIHAKHLIHFDLKPENVLVQNFTIKLIDFGICKEISNEKTSTQTIRQGTKRYEPPENNEIDFDNLEQTDMGETKKRVSTAFDIWSFGLILNEIFGSEKPYGEKNFNQISIALISKQPFQISKSINDKKLEALINKCLIINPHERINAKGIIYILIEILKDNMISYSKTIDIRNLYNKKESKYYIIIIYCILY